MKKTLKILIALTSFLTIANVSLAEDMQPKKAIRKIVFENLPRFDQNFDENVTNYSATAYERNNKIKLFSFADRPGYSVSYQVGDGEWVNVNAIGSDERKALQFVDNNEITLNNGMNVIKVKYTKDDGSQEDKIYTFNINKVDYDFRGRTQIDKSNIRFKLEGEDYQDFNSLYNINLSKDKSITFDLSEVRDLSRIEAVVNEYKKVGPGKITIEVSEDGNNWKEVINKGHAYVVNADTEPQRGALKEGIMGANGWHKPFIRYEFGEYLENGEDHSNAVFGVRGRYIRYKFNDSAPDLGNNFKFTEFDIYETVEANKDKNPTIPELNEVNASKNLAEPYQLTGDYGNIAEGQKIVIERGMPTLSWTPSATYGRGFMTDKELQYVGFNGAMFYDAPIENDRYMVFNPNSFWSVVKAPNGVNRVEAAGEPGEFINEKMKPYLNNLVDITFGDESGYSLNESMAVGRWIDWAKQKYPGVLMHTNENSSWTYQGINTGLERYRSHVKNAHVDALTFDRYHPELYSDNNGDRNHLIQKLLKQNVWYVQRQVALEGNNFVNGVGDGTKPIVFGQYLDVFVKDNAMSAKNIIVDLSLLSGMKWLAYFRTEYDFDKSWLFDRDGTPTKGAEEVGKVARRIEKWSPYFTRLNNEYIAILTTDGSQVGNIHDNFRIGSFKNATLSFDKNKEFNIKDVLVDESTKGYTYNTYSRQFPSDIALGYFKKLPGLTNPNVRSKFYSNNPKAFMLLNGTVAGSASTYNYYNGIGKYNGSEEMTERTIKLKFFNGDIELYRIDDEGVVHKVDYKVIKTSDDKTEGELEVTLPGGRAGFFFWGLDLSKLIGKHEFGEDQVLVVRRNDEGKLITEIRKRSPEDQFPEEKDLVKKRIKDALINKLGNALLEKENEDPDSEGIEPTELGDDFETALDTLGAITNKDGSSTDFKFSNLGFYQIRKIAEDSLDKNREIMRRSINSSNKMLNVYVNGDTGYKKYSGYNSFENKLNFAIDSKVNSGMYSGIFGLDGEYKFEKTNYEEIKTTTNIPYINVYHKSEMYNAYLSLIVGYKYLNSSYESENKELTDRKNSVLNIYSELGYNINLNNYIKELPVKLQLTPYLGYDRVFVKSSKYEERQDNLNIIYKSNKYDISKLVLGTALNVEYGNLIGNIDLEYRYLLSEDKLKVPVLFGGVDMYVEEETPAPKHYFVGNVDLGIKLNDNFKLKINGKASTERGVKVGAGLSYQF